MSRPLASWEARNIVASYWQIPNIMRIENTNIMDDVWKMAGCRDFARRRIVDARLALTLLRKGVTHFATSNVKDFEDFGFVKVWNLLSG